jgi:hypothetical protein
MTNLYGKGVGGSNIFKILLKFKDGVIASGEELLTAGEANQDLLGFLKRGKEENLPIKADDGFRKLNRNFDGLYSIEIILE